MKSKSNRFWAALLAGILLLCAAAIFYISTRGPKGPVAVIYSGGQEVRRIDLGAVTEDETFVLTGFGGLAGGRYHPHRLSAQRAGDPDGKRPGQRGGPGCGVRK